MFAYQISLCKQFTDFFICYVLIISQNYYNKKIPFLYLKFENVYLWLGKLILFYLFIQIKTIQLSANSQK